MPRARPQQSLPSSTPAAANATASAAAHGAPPAVDAVDTSFLRTLAGYNTRRAALAIIEVFMQRMAPFELKVVEFSVLTLVAHNPGITSRQLCATLGVLPPNLVGLIATLEKRGLIERLPHPSDGRAMGVHLTPAGSTFTAEAERTVAQLELDTTARLTAAERKTLLRLLQKLYD